MSCDMYAPDALALRPPLAYETDEYVAESGMQGDTFRLKTLAEQPAVDKRLKVTFSHNSDEPYATCLAGESGVGAQVHEAWEDENSTFIVMDDYPLGTLLAYGKRKLSEREYEELDEALMSLYHRMEAAPGLCHEDLHDDNVVLRRRADGLLEAAAIDWGFSEVGESCAREAFEFLIETMNPRLLDKLHNLKHEFSSKAASKTPGKRAKPQSAVAGPDVKEKRALSFN